VCGRRQLPGEGACCRMMYTFLLKKNYGKLKECKLPGGPPLLLREAQCETPAKGVNKVCGGGGLSHSSRYFIKGSIRS